MSSSKKVLAAVPASERANLSFNLSMDKLPVERDLGMIWNVEADAFEFKVIASDKPETKRGILPTVASLYDPLGLAAPVMLLPKCQLQRLWQLKLTGMHNFQTQNWWNGDDGNQHYQPSQT
jgi:hypothetical protein